MEDKVAGYLMIGCNEKGEVVINHPQLEVDADGIGFIVFSTNQARMLATKLLDCANEGDKLRGVK